MALGGLGSCPGLYDPRSIFSVKIGKKMKKNQRLTSEATIGMERSGMYMVAERSSYWSYRPMSVVTDSRSGYQTVVDLGSNIILY